MISIKVPPLGESIVEATIARWLKNEGDAVTAGETLVELETDKVTVEVPALKAGVLARRTKQEGDVVAVDDVLGEIDESGAAAAIRFWRDTARFRSIARGVLQGTGRSGAILDPSWFHARVEEGVSFDALMGDRRPLSFLVADLHTGRVSVRGNRTERSGEALRAVSRGAYALPPLLPPVTLGGELLVDGGLLHNAPLTAAVELGATEIVYLCNVHALPAKGFESPPSTIAFAWRYAEIFFRRASNVGFVDAEIVDGRFRDVPFLAIAPPASIRFGSLLRWMLPTVDAARYLTEAGARAALSAVERPRLGADHDTLEHLGITK